MTNNLYGGFNPNPYQQQLQQLQQRVQAMQPLVGQAPPQIQQTQIQEDRILSVSNEDVAKNTNIPLDGSTTYFKYGDYILSRRWNISEGRVSSKIYKIQQEEPIQEVEEKEDRLKGIEETLQEILKKVTYPINSKKGVKADVE